MADQNNDAPKKRDKSPEGKKSTFSDVYSTYKSEYRAIVWPSRKDLIKNTITVVVISLMFGLYIAGLDAVLGGMFNAFVNFLG
jgi:preprotein translocase subunit SecE